MPTCGDCKAQIDKEFHVSARSHHPLHLNGLYPHLHHHHPADLLSRWIFTTKHCKTIPATKVPFCILQDIPTQKKVSSENQTSNPNLIFPPCHIHHFPVSFPMFFRPLVRTSGPPGPPVKVGAWIGILLCKRELGIAKFLASGFTQHVRFTRSN